jgi:NADH dehydrogenase FAD-containing subunit
LRLRSRILFAFEKAENETNPVEHDRLMTIVVVGGGPTGVELASSFAELTRKVLNLDFRRIDPAQSHVMLLEGGSRILSHLPPDLSEKAKWQLIHLGVNVKTDTQVKSISEGVVELANGKIIKAELNASTEPPPRPPFKYWDKGTMATIGRSAAVAQIGKIKLSGYSAWLAWLFVHLIFLVGFRNRTAVLFQ